MTTFLSPRSVTLSAATAAVVVASCATTHPSGGRAVGRSEGGPRVEATSAVGSSAAGMGGFEARRARNEGYYFDRGEIQRLGARRTSDILRRVPGLRIICDRASRVGCTVRSTISPPAIYNTVRGRVVADGDCPMQYFVDGQPQPANSFELDELRPEDIAGLEAYTHAAAVPPVFNRGATSRCGVIAVWTGPSQD